MYSIVMEIIFGITYMGMFLHILHLGVMFLFMCIFFIHFLTVNTLIQVIKIDI